MVTLTEKIDQGLDAFREACRPPQRLLPSDYAHDRVAIYEEITALRQDCNAMDERTA